MTTPKLFILPVSLNVLNVTDYAEYPALAELTDYLRYNFTSSIGLALVDAVAETLTYFDLVHHARNVSAKTLIVSGSRSSVVHASVLRPVQSALSGESQLFESHDSSFRDGLYCEQWITENLVSNGVDPIVPLHWS